MPGSTRPSGFRCVGRSRSRRCSSGAGATRGNRSDPRRDQAERFPLCRPQPLQSLFERVGLKEVALRAIEIPTVFESFEDYWTPFLGRTAAGPAYLDSVADEVRERIRRHLESRLGSAGGGPIALTARAWAVQGIV